MKNTLFRIAGVITATVSISCMVIMTLSMIRNGGRHIVIGRDVGVPDMALDELEDGWVDRYKS